MSFELPNDRPWRYVAGVLDGSIAASEDVGLCCHRMARDFTDRAGGAHPQLIWDASKPQRFEEFCRKRASCVHPETGQTVPLELTDWQSFFWGMLLGWIVGEGDPMYRFAGTRRFRQAFLLTGKGSGKTPGMAAFSLFHMRWDEPRELDPQVYVSAATMEQGILTHEYAEKMIENSPFLSRAFRVHPASKNNAKISMPDARGLFQVVPYHHDAKGLAGPIASLALVDEYHEHRHLAMFESLSKGTKNRRQGLIVAATNAGDASHGPAWEMQATSKDINHGKMELDSHFGAVFSIDKGDDPYDESLPLHERTCIYKSNPGLPESVPPMHYIAKEVAAAGASADARRSCTRWLFGIFQEAQSGVWLEHEAWRRAMDMPDPTPEQLAMWDCFLGCDLAEIKDLVAIAAVFRSPDRMRYHGTVRAFTCEGTLREKAVESRGILKWIEQGLIRVSKGGVIDYRDPAAYVKELLDAHNVVGMAYDRHKINDFKDALRANGIEPTDNIGWEKPHLWCVDHPQGVKSVPVIQGDTSRDEDMRIGMHHSIARMERLFLGEQETISLEENELLTWSAAATMITRTTSGLRKLDKEDPRTGMKRYTDPVVALTMAAGLACTKAQSSVQAWLDHSPEQDAAVQ